MFLWDEVPYMIDHIRRASGEQAAVEVLDTLTEPAPGTP